jgi:hypothetical protein
MKESWDHMAYIDKSLNKTLWNHKETSIQWRKGFCGMIIASLWQIWDGYVMWLLVMELGSWKRICEKNNIISLKTLFKIWYISEMNIKNSCYPCMPMPLHSYRSGIFSFLLESRLVLWLTLPNKMSWEW